MKRTHKPDYGKRKPIIINRSSYQNIPEELRELSDDISHIAKTVYKNILTINWHGSIPRGDFVFDESDADISIIIEDDFKDGHREQREALLENIKPKWRERGITKLDVIAVPKSQLHDDFRRNGLFFCESDGIYLPDYPRLDLSFTIPKTNLELVTLLSRYFKLWVDEALTDIHELTKEQIYNQVWKRTYRAIYGLAILSGAPYEQSWRKYTTLIKQYTPNYAKLMSPLLQSNVPIEEIVTLGKDIANQLQERGVKFKTSWN